MTEEVTFKNGWYTGLADDGMGLHPRLIVVNGESFTAFDSNGAVAQPRTCLHELDVLYQQIEPVPFGVAAPFRDLGLTDFPEARECPREMAISEEYLKRLVETHRKDFKRTAVGTWKYQSPANEIRLLQDRQPVSIGSLLTYDQMRDIADYLENELQNIMKKSDELERKQLIQKGLRLLERLYVFVEDRLAVNAVLDAARSTL